jgi:hypothetical protein
VAHAACYVILSVVPIYAQKAYSYDMERLKHHWKRVPSSIRRPIVLIVGTLFIIASVLTGWLPGPGGIPLFLIGIAILATEFERAQAFRDLMLRWVHNFGKWYRQHRILGTLLLGICIAGAISVAIFMFQKLR